MLNVIFCQPLFMPDIELLQAHNLMPLQIFDARKVHNFQEVTRYGYQLQKLNARKTTFFANILQYHFFYWSKFIKIVEK